MQVWFGDVGHTKGEISVICGLKFVVQYKNLKLGRNNRGGSKRIYFANFYFFSQQYWGNKKIMCPIMTQKHFTGMPSFSPLGALFRFKQKEIKYTMMCSNTLFNYISNFTPIKGQRTKETTEIGETQV